MGGERRKKEGKGEREGRKGTEEGPTKNSCLGAQNVKLRHWQLSMLFEQFFTLQVSKHYEAFYINPTQL